ncbi:MAG: metal-dependent transcriptional regulator [Candidatus Promineifilaceae bacterium]
MNISDAAQVLLEQIWVSTEEEAESGLPLNGTLPDGAAELLHLELVERDEGCLVLTPAGRPEATQAVRRHRLAERLLADVLMTDAALLDEQACRLENILLFHGLDDSICTLLGHPRFCPHGRPIPPGKCCHQMRESVGRLIAPLCDLEPGRGGHIAYIQMNDLQRLQKLMAMNLLPGVSITLMRRSPSFVFEAGYSQFAVDEDIAAGIYVRLNPE